jgi:hypothetical protein
MQQFAKAMSGEQNLPMVPEDQLDFVIKLYDLNRVRMHQDLSGWVGGRTWNCCGMRELHSYSMCAVSSLGAVSLASYPPFSLLPPRPAGRANHK